MTLGKGRAEAITDDDFYNAAMELGCDPAVIEAIAQVETGGFGWFKDGRIKILFEKHWMYRLTSEAIRAKAVSRGLATKKWQNNYKDQNGADARYSLLERAVALNKSAAFGSVSVGRFQIMGFNHGICGFKTPEQMFNSFVDSEVNQLNAFINFMKAKNLEDALKNKDYNLIEQRYNGGGLNGKYARLMKKKEKELAGKWKTFKPSNNKPNDTKDLGKGVEKTEQDQGLTLTPIQVILSKILTILKGLFNVR